LVDGKSVSGSTSSLKPLEMGRLGLFSPLASRQAPRLQAQPKATDDPEDRSEQNRYRHHPYYRTQPIGLPVLLRARRLLGWRYGGFERRGCRDVSHNDRGRGYLVLAGCRIVPADLNSWQGEVASFVEGIGQDIGATSAGNLPLWAFLVGKSRIVGIKPDSFGHR